MFGSLCRSNISDYTGEHVQRQDQKQNATAKRQKFFSHDKESETGLLQNPRVNCVRAETQSFLGSLLRVFLNQVFSAKIWEVDFPWDFVRRRSPQVPEKMGLSVWIL